jgi:FtsP/CotA-like multicopper oxidase with cupredoxin domain
MSTQTHDLHAGHHSNGSAPSHDTHGADTDHDAPQSPATDGHHAGSAHGAHGAHGMGARVTRPQLTVVTVLTVLALALGVAIPASQVNLTLSGRDVGGLIMPPGMIMSADTSADAMRDMAAVDPHEVSGDAPSAARGDQPLPARLVNGAKVFDLTVAVTGWHILPDRRVEAYAVNGQVPGPRLRVTQGDRVRVNVRNDLPDPTSIHWHGLILPNAMDGAADITQPAIEPGSTYTYEFTARQQGSYFYHSHAAADRQQSLGLYGALIVDPADPAVDAAYDYDHEVVVQLQEWLHRDGFTYPAMPMEGALPNYFTINGKAYPDTETIHMRVGERLRVRFLGTHNSFVHPMHIHGGPFRIVQTDGEPVPPAAQLLKDTVNVGPGERYDVIWEANEPGKWLLHCHIPHHTTNNNVEEHGGGGLMAVIEVTA